MAAHNMNGRPHLADVNQNSPASFKNYNTKIIEFSCLIEGCTPQSHNILPIS